jgi:signal transduction histidine kinase
MTGKKKENVSGISESAFHLDVDAQVVRQLGAELITDPEQALLELVKNSYDADSEWCNVEIEPDAEAEIEIPGDREEERVSRRRKLKGKIVIKDDGSGMNVQTLQSGWLTISLSPKRRMKELGEVTPKFHRTPLGDKGLGRLGTMKLGDYLRIATFHHPDKKGVRISFFWSQCKSGLPLTQVPLTIEELPAKGERGTEIEILGLADLDYWRGEDRINKLRLKLSTLISPFKTFSDFTIGLTIGGNAVDLVSFSEKVLNTATAHFECTFDGSGLEMSGKVKLGIFKGTKGEDFERYVLSDSGKALFDYLGGKAFADGIALDKSKSRVWYLEFQQLIQWKELPIIFEQLAIANPGEFISELYAFNLNFAREQSENLFNEFGDLGSTLKELSGVYIFRDNFRVRAGNDWLKLGEAWTSGGSYYGLRPKNTIGYFAITAQGNPKLLEKSDREGFIENAEYRGFYALASRLKEFANTSLEDLRRGYSEFRDKCKERDSGFPQGISAEDQAEQLNRLAKAAKTIGTTLKVSAKERASVLSDAKAEIKTLLEREPSNSAGHKSIAKTLATLDRLARKIDEENQDVRQIVDQVAEKDQMADIISQRFEQLNDQITETYETVGIGLAAQGLVHELHPLLEEIAARARKVKTAIERHSSEGFALATSELDTIRIIASLISRKMSFLDPMLRTFKESREDIDLEKFIKDFFDLRHDRLDKLGIKTFIDPTDSPNLIVRINRGRLTQVLDNLERNSEYWLKDFGLKNPERKLEIHAKIDGSKLIFYDTGPGVRTALEKTIFDIFVTDKPKGQGHGLGLFIISQVLKAEGCSIYLGTKRNEHGRRFEFVVDFSSAIK